MLKHQQILQKIYYLQAVAFGRLCVETPDVHVIEFADGAVAFGRLCVETTFFVDPKFVKCRQSPSGGCVLKRFAHKRFLTKQEAVAFGRLCVETSHVVGCQCAGCAVAFGRLCVETSKIANGNLTALAAASVRLCVETSCSAACGCEDCGSRLRAAVC